MTRQHRDQRHFSSINFFITLLFIAFSFGVKAVSLPDGPQVGQIAPTLKLPVWLQAPPEAVLGWPTGKVVVLEFWSTGCGPCVAAIPDLNELADKFADKPVQFIAVTDDPVSVIKRFLKKTPIHAWIGLGPEAGFGENTPYKVYAIPHTVLIDTHGRIAAIIDPWMLTAAVIQRCLDGGSVKQTSAKNKKHATVEYRWSFQQIPGWVPGQYNAGIKPLYQVMIRPTPTNSTSATYEYEESWVSGMALTAQDDTLKRAIQTVFDVKPTRIVADTTLPKGKYDFYINLPHRQTQAAFEALFSQAVAATFGLTVKREARDIDVLVLRTNATSLERLSQSTDPQSLYSAFWNEAAATNQPLKSLAEELEISSSMPVLDETGLTNRYNFDIKWKQKDYSHPNIEGMVAAVKELGLNLTSVKQSTEVVVVSKAPDIQ
jgi:uncharacterized protein (TIGR03435 family)